MANTAIGYENIVNLSRNIRMVTAPNPSPMTFRGTNTYFLGHNQIAVIDPGPDNDAHLDAILKATKGQNITHILLTHSHADHSPLARRLSKITSAPIYGFADMLAAMDPVLVEMARSGDIGGAEGLDPDHYIDVNLDHGDHVKVGDLTVTALHTPGHLADHLCYAIDGTGVVFSGDHVMAWATTMISPPYGDLTAFRRSMGLMAARTEDRIYYPGHGGAVTEPHSVIKAQLAHRQMRESQILQTLPHGPQTPMQLVEKLYVGVDKNLWGAASRNVLAHLIDLTSRGQVAPDGVIGKETKFGLL